ncbi:MAG: glycosyltransferase family 2 protein, partial [Ruminococcus flavefaciens]|nr:glycosyltransferase family 2 protein [Ruminococcus flavefaciens]
MSSITIITPTYNRADLLPRLYESLLKQTNTDFEWMVIDDGSM